jgi:hypothetical protein
MAVRYRLTDSHGEVLHEADTVGYLQGLVGDFEPGHYVVDELTTGPEPAGPTARRWGVIFKLVDGTLLVEPEPE